MWMVFVANRWVSVGTPGLGEVSRVFNANARSRALGARAIDPPQEDSPGLCRHFREAPVSWEGPDPERDEDYPDPVIKSSSHHCIVLTPDWWMCEDCGQSFARDKDLGDFPEEAVIENGQVCVAYIPELTA